MTDENDVKPEYMLKYMPSTYKPGWLAQLDLHINNTRGRMKEMVVVTQAYDEILSNVEKALVTSFTDQIEQMCAKFLKEIFKINPNWEIILNPEAEWWLKKKRLSSK